MKIYRIYYIEYDYINHTYYYDDDEYPDEWVEETQNEITVKYVDSIEKWYKFIDNIDTSIDYKEYDYEEIIVD